MSRPERYNKARKKLIREKFALLCQRLDYTFKQIATLRLKINGNDLTESRIYGISRGKVMPNLALIEKLLDVRGSFESGEKIAILDEWSALLTQTSSDSARLAGPGSSSQGSDAPLEWLEEKMGQLEAIRDVADPLNVFHLIGNRVSQEVAARDRDKWLISSTLDQRILVFFRADARTDWLNADPLLQAWAKILESNNNVDPKVTLASVGPMPSDQRLSKAIKDLKSALKRKWSHHDLHWHHLGDPSQQGSEEQNARATYPAALDDPDFLRNTMIFGYFSLTDCYFNLSTQTVPEQLASRLTSKEGDPAFLWWTQVAKIDGPLALALLEVLGWRSVDGTPQPRPRWMKQQI